MRSPPGSVRYSPFVQRHSRRASRADLPAGFSLAQCLLYLLSCFWCEFHRELPGAQAPSSAPAPARPARWWSGRVHILLNQAVDRRSQLRYLAHNLFMMATSAALRCRVSLNGWPDAMGGSWSVSPLDTARPPPAAMRSGLCHIGQPHHRALVEQEQGVAEIGCLPIALQQLRVVEERRSPCAHPRRHSLHSPTARCVGARPMTRGRVSSGSRLMALMTARNWVVFPTPAYPLNHRELVRALQNHPSPPAVRRSGPSSDCPARGPSGGHRVFTFQHPSGCFSASQV